MMKKDKKKESRVTEKALYISLFAMTVSCAMLFESTYAWFTQTVSTPVSVIQTGNMSVQLVVADEQGFVEAVNQEKAVNNLIFREYNVEKPGESGDTVFQPGRTYCLPAIYVQNTGNIDLSYTVTLAHNSDVADAVQKSIVNEQGEEIPISLYDVLEFSGYIVTDNEVDATSEAVDGEDNQTLSEPIPLIVAREGVVSEVAATEEEDSVKKEITGVLEAAEEEGNVPTSQAIIIQVRMDENADIAYAGLELSGLQIIVNTTQIIPDGE